MKTIAILMTCHNRKNKTLACLKALYECVFPDQYCFELFLVDDGSTDGTSKAVKEEFPSIMIIKGDGNLFWNRGMHLAWQTALIAKDFDYYLWLNDDTTLCVDAIVSLMNVAEFYQNKSIVVGSTHSSNNEKYITYGGRDKNGSLILPTSQAVDCYYFNGNIVLIPKAVYEILGTNDPVFRHALGDFDYGLRAQKMQITAIVAPDFLGECDAHESLSTWCNPEKKFKERWSAFRSPLGNNPEEFFIYEQRHNGLIKALFHYLTNHLRVINPWIWNFKTDKQ